MGETCCEVKEWLESFAAAMEEGDVEAVAELFAEEECFWRDLVAFTWNLYTAESRQEIKEMLRHTLSHAKPRAWLLLKDLPPDTPGISHAFLAFETSSGRCTGHVRIKDGKCWTLLTALQELKGFEEKAGPRRERGVMPGAFRNRKVWVDERRDELERLGMSMDHQPFCVIVGGGHAGITLAARLRRLHVPTIILDKTARPGDVWRNRYKPLHFHDTVWSQHMPYIPFPDHFPVFCSKDQFADWLEAYTKIMALVYWSSSECKSAKFDARAGTWEVEVEREGKTVMLYPKELVMATSLWGFPRVPSFHGADSFQGVQLHSSQYKSGTDWKGKKCVVIGSGTSAHDICADLWEQGAAQVTMVQRSPTVVIKYDTLRSLLPPHYAEDSPFSTMEADLLLASLPFKLLSAIHIPLSKALTCLDAPLYEGLQSCGFLYDFDEDGAGMYLKLLRQASGYYLDVGASQLLIDGEVKLKSGVGVKELKTNSLVLTDGSELDVDLIVYATGYGSINEVIAKLISEDTAKKVGRCWGLGSGTKWDPSPWERELRNFWKPVQEPHLWIHGGSLHQSRPYSLYLALQLKARLEGIPTLVYGLATTRHVE